MKKYTVDGKDYVMVDGKLVEIKTSATNLPAIFYNSKASKHMIGLCFRKALLAETLEDCLNSRTFVKVLGQCLDTREGELKAQANES